MRFWKRKPDLVKFTAEKVCRRPTAPKNATELVGIQVVDTNDYPPKKGEVLKVDLYRKLRPESSRVRGFGDNPVVVVRYTDGEERTYFLPSELCAGALLAWCRKGWEAWLLIGPWFTFSPDLFPEKCDEIRPLELATQLV